MDNVKNSYKVSIGIPVYGVEKYIERCARSLLGQTYENIEYIFVNDCTKDQSIDILKKVVKDFPNRKDYVKIVNHETNRGLAAARNTAVENATGLFLMWVDSDDYIDKYCVEKVVAKQIESEADIVAFDSFWDYESHKVKHVHQLSDNAHEDCLNICACKSNHAVWGRLYRRSLYIDNNIKVIEGDNMGEDRQVVPLLYFYSQKVVSLHEPLYFYYIGNQFSITANLSLSKVEQWIASQDIVKKFFANKGKEYQTALEIGSAILYSQLMAGCCRSKSNEMFNFVQKHLDLIDMVAVKQVPLFYRIYFYIKSRRILMFYTSIGHILITKIRKILNKQ